MKIESYEKLMFQVIVPNYPTKSCPLVRFIPLDPHLCMFRYISAYIEERDHINNLTLQRRRGKCVISSEI